MKYLYNDNFEEKYKVAESEAEFKTLSYEEKGLCIDTFYSVMWGLFSPLTHTDSEPDLWYDLDLLHDLGYHGMDIQYNLSEAIEADEIKPLTDDDLLKMFNSALNKYRIFNHNNDGYTVQPQTKKELAYIIKNTCKRKGWNCDLNFIDTSKITDMSRLFANIPTCIGGYGFRKFNCDISHWDVSNVTDMSMMFFMAKFFNRPLNNWNVSNVTDMSSMFEGATKFNQPLDKWDVSSVSYMQGMFKKAISFNQPLNKWNVSKVYSMNRMFKKAISFNQSLDEWDTKNVISFLGTIEMFKGAKNFDCKIPSFNFKNFEIKHLDNLCFLLGLSDKYAEKHQLDFNCND